MYVCCLSGSRSTHCCFVWVAQHTLLFCMDTHVAKQLWREGGECADWDFPCAVIQRLDVDYLLVVFGGMIGYSSDDINKFLWMVRIGGGVCVPEVQEADYYTNGEYRVRYLYMCTLAVCVYATCACVRYLCMYVYAICICVR